MRKHLQANEPHLFSSNSFKIGRYNFRLFNVMIIFFVFFGLQPGLYAQQKIDAQPNRDTAVRSTVTHSPRVANAAKLFSYSTSSFSSGSNESLYLYPEVFKQGGVFSYRRISSGYGALNINLSTGALALMACDLGIYEICYSIGNQQQKMTFTITK